MQISLKINIYLLRANLFITISINKNLMSEQETEKCGTKSYNNLYMDKVDSQQTSEQRSFCYVDKNTKKIICKKLELISDKNENTECS